MGQNPSALRHAAAIGDVASIASLAGQGFDINAKEQESQWTALHFAAWGGHASTARELLVLGADVNARDNEDKTPLHLAALAGHEETIQALCDHGALVNAADIDGQTPLHKVTASGQLQLAQELTARGGNIDARLKDGSTPLHLASWKGHSALLAYLLESGANVAATNLREQTALHEAAAAGHNECCQLLLRHGASTAVLDADLRTPADLAQLNEFVRTAHLVRPQPGEVETRLRRQRAELASRGAHLAETVQPTAPTWIQRSDSGAISYPVIDYPASTHNQPALQVSSDLHRSRSSHAGPATDWEQQEEDDWEPVAPATLVPSRGAELMNNYAQDHPHCNHQDAGLFWMVPEPIRWAAGTFGGILSNFNPWRAQVQQEEQQQQRQQREGEAAEAQESLQVQQAALEEREAEVARLSEPHTRERLTAEQLAKLSRQEAVIADLRQKLDAMRLGQSAPVGAGAASQPQPEPEHGSSQSRHHIIDLPERPAPLCREVTIEELSAATEGFADSNRLGDNMFGTFFKGTLQGAAVAVWVPHHRDAVPWHALKAAADRLAGVTSGHVVPLRAVCPDGSSVFDLMQNGSVEDALRSRPPSSGRPPVRLDWPTRVEVALHAAEGLADLHRASPPLLHGALSPSSVLLAGSLTARITPPSLASIAYNMQVQPASSHIAPEVRRGEPATAQSDVFSLGVLLLQLITGSEASGLLDHIQSQVSRGRLAEVLDPCADRITAQQALPLARLALRCLEYHQENRPDLEEEVLPSLHSIFEQSILQSTLQADDDPPTHLVCPITQDIMISPVLLSDGFTYEEDAIKKWLNRGKRVSPMTNARLAHTNLTPNYVIKSAASTWREQHPGYGVNSPSPRPGSTARQQASTPSHEDELAVPQAEQSSRQQQQQNQEQRPALEEWETSSGDELPAVPTTRIPVATRHTEGELARQALAG